MENTMLNTKTIDKTTYNIAQDRIEDIYITLNGERKLDARRWENHTSVRNTHRIVNFLTNMIDNKAVNVNRYKTLQQEITNFNTVLGTNLSKKLQQTCS